MNILLTGADGQLGRQLRTSLAPLGHLTACNRSTLDLARPETLGPILNKLQPDVIVNAAAFTAVDRAETDEYTATLINSVAVGELAEWSRANDSLLIHYSTDYVFDGTKPTPYVESDETNPINAYGRSKLAGERMIAAIAPPHLCLRTSWLYSAERNNFVRTILQLAKEHETLRVVSDQVGAPTRANDLAAATSHLVARALDRRKTDTFKSGLYHMTSHGEATRNAFAEAIVAAARSHGGSLRTQSVQAILTSEYATPAARPLNSRLSNLALATDWSIELPDWRASLDDLFGSYDLTTI